jgi:hypothetical protein
VHQQQVVQLAEGDRVVGAAHRVVAVHQPLDHAGFEHSHAAQHGQARHFAIQRFEVFLPPHGAVGVSAGFHSSILGW